MQQSHSSFQTLNRVQLAEQLRLLNIINAGILCNGIARIDSCDVSGLPEEILSADLCIASDVTNPLCGETGAARVFAPQKGADPAMVEELEKNLLQPIVRIVRPRSTTVGFTAPEYLLSYLAQPTTRYRVTFDAYKDTPFSATIKSFARTSSDALGFPVSLRLVDVDTMRYNISPGMTCIASVVIVESDSEAVSVPLTAIYAPVGDDDYVWVIDGDDIVEKRRVILGELTGEGSVVVVDGLKSGERVVSAGVYHLTNGERVRIL